MNVNSLNTGLAFKNAYIGSEQSMHKMINEKKRNNPNYLQINRFLAEDEMKSHKLSQDNGDLMIVVDGNDHTELLEAKTRLKTAKEEEQEARQKVSIEEEKHRYLSEILICKALLNKIQ